MVALFILLFAVAVSIFINSVATKALVLTGLSRDVAAFQARSVTTGTGFTTNEAESLVKHPTRRRIVMLLMIIQNAGLITVISTFVLSFISAGSSGIAFQRAVILVIGLAFLVFLSKNQWVERQVGKLIDWFLQRYTQLKVVDYHNLLNLQEGYTVSRFKVDEDSWLSDKTLDELDLQAEGVMILCIECSDGSITCAPTGQDTLSSGDMLSVYGRENGLQELRDRRNDTEGEEAHQEAKRKHREEEQKRN